MWGLFRLADTCIEHCTDRFAHPIQQSVGRVEDQQNNATKLSSLPLDNISYNCHMSPFYL